MNTIQFTTNYAPIVMKMMLTCPIVTFENDEYNTIYGIGHPILHKYPAIIDNIPTVTIEFIQILQTVAYSYL
jgi:hypothetical protein